MALGLRLYFIRGNGQKSQCWRGFPADCAVNSYDFTPSAAPPFRYCLR